MVYLPQVKDALPQAGKYPESGREKDRGPANPGLDHIRTMESVAIR
jgi:hypothetical protein